jgi:hypothetical protein
MIAASCAFEAFKEWIFYPRIARIAANLNNEEGRK